MPFQNITKLTKANIESANYFVDANVWIYSLINFDDLEFWENKYYQFFYDIIESNLDPKPKILMPVLLLSEIVNTYLRKFAIPQYKLENTISEETKIDFKKDYRITTHYKDNYESIMDDIYNLRDSINFIDDSLISSNVDLLLNNSTGDFDYNDYIYYNLCKEINKKEKVILLTNDSDFAVSDLEVITLNKTLIALKASL